MFKFVKDMCVAKLRVKELCAEVCVKELHVCVYESVVCGSVCVFKFVRERITFKRI